MVDGADASVHRKHRLAGKSSRVLMEGLYTAYSSRLTGQRCDQVSATGGYLDQEPCLGGASSHRWPRYCVASFDIVD